VSEPATVTMPFSDLLISGNVYDDGDGDSNVDGVAISAPDGVQLYVTLLDSNNNVIASKAVLSEGDYSFDGNDGLTADNNYTIVLSTEANATTASLPERWNNTGENVNSLGDGNDGAADGKVSISVASDNISAIDFGINKKPTAVDKVEISQVNPGGDTQVDVPTLEGNDTETPDDLIFNIISLPDNAKLYCDGTEVTEADLNKTCAPDKLTVDPDDGEQTVTFKYTVTDPTGAVSEPATVTMPFSDLFISGNVYDDGDGDGDVDGVAISAPDGVQIYITLIKDGNVVASKAVSDEGQYSFSAIDGLEPNSDYSLVLSTEANATTASLPENWSNTGEVVNNSGSGNDGAVDGKTDVSVEEANIPNIDFGINKRPEAINISEEGTVNPGGDNQVDVPTLEGNDTETPDDLIFNIISIPENAKLYCDGTEITESDLNKTCEPDKLTVDPDDGEQIVIFAYTTTDPTGAVSEPATVTIPFTDLMISGNVYDDGNGDGNVNGVAISAPDGVQLYVTLIKDGSVVASKAVASDGKYNFIVGDGLEPNSDYSIVLSKEANSTTASLPENWSNTGEVVNNSGSGNDGAVDGKTGKCRRG